MARKRGSSGRPASSRACAKQVCARSSISRCSPFPEHSNHTRLITHGFGVVRRSAERLGPVGSQALRVLWVIAVREGVAHNRIGQASRVPCSRQVQERLTAACRFVNGLRHRDQFSHGIPDRNKYYRSLKWRSDRMARVPRIQPLFGPPGAQSARSLAGSRVA